MNNDDRFEFGHDNRIILLKNLIERHIKDTHNPHQVGLADLSSGKEEIITNGYITVEDNTVYLILERYAGGDPIKIQLPTGEGVSWDDLMGNPLDNAALATILRPLMEASKLGVGYSIVDLIDGKTYGFDTEYDMTLFDIEGSEETLYYNYDAEQTERIYLIIKDFDKSILVQQNGEAYYYRQNIEDESIHSWYKLINGNEFEPYDVPNNITITYNSQYAQEGKEDYLLDILVLINTPEPEPNQEEENINVEGE